MISRYITFFVFALTSVSSLAATTLPDPIFATWMSYGGVGDAQYVDYSAPGSYSLGADTALLSTFPDLTEEVDTPGTPLQGEGQVQTTYYFAVVGGPAEATIPLLISGDLWTTYSGDGSAAGANLDAITAIDSAEVNVYSSSHPVAGLSASWSGTLSLSYLSGDEYIGENYIVLGVSTTSDLGSSAEAFGDPYIYVDPSFPNAASYSVVVSDGIGNGPTGTPEPASLVLVGSALLAAACFRRRKAPKS